MQAIIHLMETIPHQSMDFNGRTQWRTRSPPDTVDAKLELAQTTPDRFRQVIDVALDQFEPQGFE
nr:hypothetical protein [Propionivibrio sp.]